MWENHQCFVVMADNGEEYEDYRDYRLGIFYKEEDTKLYLKNGGWKEGNRPNSWYRIENRYGYDSECHAWIEEDSVKF